MTEQFSVLKNQTWTLKERVSMCEGILNGRNIKLHWGTFLECQGLDETTEPHSNLNATLD